MSSGDQSQFLVWPPKARPKAKLGMFLSFPGNTKQRYPISLSHTRTESLGCTWPHLQVHKSTKAVLIDGLVIIQEN